MTPLAGRIAFIAVGYVAAVGAGVGAVVLAEMVRSPEVAASQGMTAFGDAVLFLGVAGVVALAPTGLLVNTIARAPRFLSAASWLALALAATAPGALGAFTLGSNAPDPELWGVVVLVAWLRLCLSPVLAPLFGVATLVLPRGAARRRMLAATALEGVAAVVVVGWFAVALLLID